MSSTASSTSRGETTRSRCTSTSAIEGADRAVRVCDRLRPVLPVLLAISANSPFLDGRDSGLHSARTQTFTRSFPRCGVPDAFGGWDAYARYIDFLVRTGSIVEYTQVWWSVRPHFSFGTVEVRICDVQATAEESEALAALIVACVAQAARDTTKGCRTRTAERLIEENMWRAIRYGLDGQLLELTAASRIPRPGSRARGCSRWTAPVRAELGIDLAPPAANGAQRQRELLASGVSLQEVYAQVVAQTRESYIQLVPSAAEVNR